MNNRKARLLLKVPAGVCNNFSYYRLTKTTSLIFKNGNYLKTHKPDGWKR